MFNPCKHMKITDSEHLYCSPPHLDNVIRLMDHEVTSTCLGCCDYEGIYTKEELAELEQLVEINKKEDE